MSKSKRVGPVIFSVPAARTQLLDHGEVFTYRSKDRTVGDTHARWGRTMPKGADVRIEKVCPINPQEKDALRPYSALSGFGSTEDWQEAIAALYDRDEPPTHGYLYRVTLVQELYRP